MSINIDELQSLLVTALVRIAGAAVILLVGRWLAGVLQRSVRSLLKRTQATPAITNIIARSAYYGIMLLAVIIGLVVLGIPADLLLTALGIIAVIAAIALRESLSDLAATVNFIVFQPFKVGDVIETNGVAGLVRELLVFDTVLVSLDNRQIIIPNRIIQNSIMVNLSALKERRMDVPVPLTYAEDVSTVKNALLEIANADARVLRAPQPVVHLMKLGAGEVEYVLRVYASPADFWELLPALNERVKFLLEQKQFTVPIPQLQVHTNSSTATSNSMQ